MKVLIVLFLCASTVAQASQLAVPKGGPYTEDEIAHQFLVPGFTEESLESNYDNFLRHYLLQGMGEVDGRNNPVIRQLARRDFAKWFQDATATREATKHICKLEQLLSTREGLVAQTKEKSGNVQSILKHYESCLGKDDKKIFDKALAARQALVAFLNKRLAEQQDSTQRLPEFDFLLKREKPVVPEREPGCRLLSCFGSSS